MNLRTYTGNVWFILAKQLIDKIAKKIKEGLIFLDDYTLYF